jgi:gas vesicle protein
MSEALSDVAASGEYRSSGRRPIGFGLGMLVVGITIGAFVALLCAPQAGEKTRRTLRRRYKDAREAMEDLGEQASDLIEKGSDWADKAREKVKPIGKSLGL